jgi:hypothetical protein
MLFFLAVYCCVLCSRGSASTQSALPCQGLGNLRSLSAVRYIAGICCVMLCAMCRLQSGAPPLLLPPGRLLCTCVLCAALLVLGVVEQSCMRCVSCELQDSCDCEHAHACEEGLMHVRACLRVEIFRHRIATVPCSCFPSPSHICQRPANQRTSSPACVGRAAVRSDPSWSGALTPALTSRLSRVCLSMCTCMYASIYARTHLEGMTNEKSETYAASS